MPNYRITFGKLREEVNSDPIKLKIKSLINDINENNTKKSVGIDKVFDDTLAGNIDLTTINSNNCDDIISNYWTACDRTFYYINNLNSRDYPFIHDVYGDYSNTNNSYHLSDVNINDLKDNLPGAKDFFKCIKDSYSDNRNTPNIENSFVNTKPLKDSLIKMGEYIKTCDHTVDNSHYNFVKWAYTTAFNCLSQYKNSALVSFSLE